jgi:hypothetical protein
MDKQVEGTPLPGVGSVTGQQYGSSIIESWTLVKQHRHSQAEQLRTETGI